MKDIALTALLEAGCHFGHKVERWHPKAASFIYAAREGIHIIDLAKSRSALMKAAEFVKELGIQGKVLLMVGTKRQAKNVVTQAAKKAGCTYLTNRWIGGFFTNWSEVKKNLDKVNSMRVERDSGAWSKFPKHEQVKLGKYLRKLEFVYEGVVTLTSLPDAVFIVDVKKEINCLKEAVMKGVTTVAIVDTNSDPTPIDYVIAGNDDAVGSIQFIVDYLADAYLEGRQMNEKKDTNKVDMVVKADDAGKKTDVKTEKKVELPEIKKEKKDEVKPVKKTSDKSVKKDDAKLPKRDRPKKK